MMKLTNEDEHTISEYLRAAHGGYSGPVFIDMKRLSELHMGYSSMVVTLFINYRLRRTYQ